MKNTVCHVHVGMPKTGTTAIQTAFSENPDPNILYAPFPNANHSTAFAVCFENRPEASRVNRLQDLTRQEALDRRRAMRRKVAHQFDAAAANGSLRDILVSGERLSNAAKANEIAHQRFKDFFATWASTFRIYGYVRPMHSLLPSDFQQRIQSGNGANLDLDWYYPKYRRKFEKFETIYGRDAISLRHYSRNRLVNGDIVADLAAQLGANLPSTKRIQSNVALSLEGTAVLFVFAKSRRIADTNQQAATKNRIVVQFLKQLLGLKMAFCPQKLAELAERNKEDLDWIETRVGAPLFEDITPRGVIIRSESELYDIAHAVAKSDAIENLPPYPGAPAPNVVAQWLRADLAALHKAKTDKILVPAY